MAGEIKVTTGILGDLTGDDDITIGDVVVLNRHILGKSKLDNNKLAYADINKDGDITIGDVVVLNRHVIGKINLFETANRGTSKSQFLKEVASQDELVKITVDSIEAKNGEEITVPVRISNNTGICGLAATVTLPQGYELKSITKGDVTSSGSFTSEGNSVTWYADDNVILDGILMNLNLKIGAGAKSGEIAVNLKEGKANNLSDENGITVSSEFFPGTITILKSDEKEQKSENQNNQQNNQQNNTNNTTQRSKIGQTMTVKTSKKTVKAAKLKKKAMTVNPITVQSAQGTVTYKITGGNKKSKKALKINSKTGKVKVKKKTKKGTYKVKVTVTAAGNDQYNAGSKTVTVTVKVK